MVYLTQFTLPDREMQENRLSDCLAHGRTCYQDFYPFRVLGDWEQEQLFFDPITIFYGGNGSGKTTLLNVIGDKLKVERGSAYNRSAFFGDYVALCQCQTVSQGVPPESAMLTSDDVFDYLLDMRSLNQGIDIHREELLEEYKTLRREKFQLKSMDDYATLKKSAYAKRKSGSGSGYVRREVGGNLRGRSNGESAFRYFTDKIQAGRLYLLDEPENSLSAQYQQELAQFLQDSARFYQCQFILSTHSPFLLAMKDAAIYDMDGIPIARKAWTQLEAVRRYHSFFQAHSQEFQNDGCT